MKDNPRMTWWQEKAADVFKEIVFSEVYGFHLFGKEPLDPGQQYYWFQPDDRGDAVWLVQHDPQKQEYKPSRFDEAKKLARVVAPRICTFWHSIYIDATRLVTVGTGIRDIEEEVSKGGQAFARTINQVFVDVLLMAATDNKVPAQSMRLDDALAQVSDGLSRAGFNADRFLFPRDFLHRLVQQGIIVRDDEIQNNHYAGKTKTGLYAFCSSELSGDTALIFDSTAGITITLDPIFKQVSAPNPFSIGIGGTVYLNPIVKNTRSIVALEGIGEVIDFKPPYMSSVPAAPASELAIEKSGMDSIKPDLDKLPIRKMLRDLTGVLIEDVNRAYRAEAYVAAVLLYRSIIEAILLGLLLKRRKQAEDPFGKDVPKDKGQVKPLEDWKLEEMIKRAAAMGLVDDTDESSIRTLQNYGNLVHAARIVKKRPFIDPVEDAKIVRSHLIKLLKRYGAVSE